MTDFSRFQREDLNTVREGIERTREAGGYVLETQRGIDKAYRMLGLDQAWLDKDHPCNDLEEAQRELIKVCSRRGVDLQRYAECVELDYGLILQIFSIETKNLGTAEKTVMSLIQDAVLFNLPILEGKIPSLKELGFEELQIAVADLAVSDSPAKK